MPYLILGVSLITTLSLVVGQAMVKRYYRLSWVLPCMLCGFILVAFVPFGFASVHTIPASRAYYGLLMACMATGGPIGALIGLFAGIAVARAAQRRGRSWNTVNGLILAIAVGFPLVVLFGAVHSTQPLAGWGTLGVVMAIGTFFGMTLDQLHRSKPVVSAEGADDHNSES